MAAGEAICQSGCPAIEVPTRIATTTTCNRCNGREELVRFRDIFRRGLFEKGLSQAFSKWCDEAGLPLC